MDANESPEPSHDHGVIWVLSLLCNQVCETPVNVAASLPIPLPLVERTNVFTHSSRMRVRCVYNYSTCTVYIIRMRNNTRSVPDSLAD